MQENCRWHYFSGIPVDGVIVTKPASQQYKSQLRSAERGFQGKSPRSRFLPINPFFLAGYAACAHIELALQGWSSTPLCMYFNELWSITVKVGSNATLSATCASSQDCQNACAASSSIQPSATPLEPRTPWPDQ